MTKQEMEHTIAQFAAMRDTLISRIAGVGGLNTLQRQTVIRLINEALGPSMNRMRQLAGNVADTNRTN